MKNKKIRWFIGCSGFYYREWKNAFYPEGLPQKKWFDYYSRHFNTLELNVTFYRFPQLSFLKNWYDKSPDEFMFSVKAPRLITHYKQFSGTAELMADFYGIVREGLQGKLGCILFQLPASIDYSPERLDRIINSVDLAFNNVIEFRNISWWNNEVYARLSENGIGFCSISIAKLPDDVRAGYNIVYYRFHGVPVLYKSSYDESFLKKIADHIVEDNKVKQAFIYFNNTASLAAINNAQWLQNYSAEHSQHQEYF